VTSTGPDSGFPSARPADFEKAHIGAGGETQLRDLFRILDLQEQMPGIVRLRDWAMAATAPSPGETCVDIGSGTGTETRRLARAVGARGRAIGVEPNPGSREEARRRAVEAGVAVEFVDGDATALPFPDGSIDLVRIERVLEHLTDPDAAVRDIARVLRPGGRAVLLDTDWGTSIVSPGDPDVVRRYHEALCAGFANPFSGRRLRWLLAAAGLEVDADTGSSAAVFPDAMLAEGAMIGSFVEQGVEKGALTADEAQGLVEQVRAAALRGEAFMAVTMFAVVGRKPE
jgi:ubiquinone/menaquinone biosynthesis C-methylase UbiE